MPKVSVIIPVYGVEKYIERCATSLFEQTLDDIEYIFVDDCTPDASMKLLGRIIEKYRLYNARKKHIVRIERMPRNSGLPSVRKHGTKLAKGDYIIHCDSDDWVDVNMCKMMYNEAVANNSDIVICDYYESDGYSHSLKHHVYSKDKNIVIVDLLFEHGSWAVWNKMVTRSLYEGVKFPRYNMGEDMALIFQLLAKSDVVSYIASPLYYYFYNSASITKQMSVDSCLNKFKQASINLQIVEDVLGQSDRFYAGLTNLKATQRNLLIPILSEHEAATLWRKTYPGLTWKMFGVKDISLKQKMRALYYHIWSYFYEFKGHLTKKI